MSVEAPSLAPRVSDGGFAANEEAGELQSARAYADPYVAGIALGFVLLAAFVFAGRGLGASGAFTSAAAGVVASISPRQAATSSLFSRYLEGEGPWKEWLLFEIAGVVIGGFLSAFVAGRLRRGTERGPNVSSPARLALACGGGAAMGLGAVLARGCTSGIALSGGALLSVGSWIFIVAAFAAAFLVAPLVKRAWR